MRMAIHFCGNFGSYYYLCGRKFTLVIGHPISFWFANMN